MSVAPLPVVVLVSGSGTNLQSFIDGQDAGTLPIEIRAVVSNRADAYGLVRAERAGIEAVTLPHGDFSDREAYDAALGRLLERYRPGLVILAGFMRILTPALVADYTGRMVNIHPSLLPAFRGLHTHERALAANAGEHGCSVHYVTPELDAGPVILQARIPVLPGDTPESLQRRVQAREHRVYPLAVRWIAEGRVALRDGTVWLDGAPRRHPPVLATNDRLVGV